MYSSSGSIAGWSSCWISHFRVDLTSQPGRPQPAQQVRLRVEVERRLPERRPGPRRPAPPASPVVRSRGEARAGPSADASCDLDAPRHAVVLHLGGDQRARGLGGEQQPQAARLVGARDGRVLAPELVERVGGLRRSGVVEQAALDGRRDARPVPGPGAQWPARTTASRRSAAGSRGRAAGRGTARPARPQPAAAGSGATCRPTPTAAGPPRARGRRRRGPRQRRRPSRRAAHPGQSATAAPRRPRATGRRGAAARTRLMVAAGSDTIVRPRTSAPRGGRSPRRAPGRHEVGAPILETTAGRTARRPPTPRARGAQRRRPSPA